MKHSKYIYSGNGDTWHPVIYKRHETRRPITDTLVMIAIAAMIAFILLVVFGMVKPSHAMGGNVTAICDTVDSNSVAAYNGHSVDSSDVHSRHCTYEVTPSNGDKPAKHHKQNSQSVITVKPASQPATHDKPAKECKNKNSGKDGTPKECNAGGGQEKHSDSALALGLYILLLKANKNGDYVPLMRGNRLATFSSLFAVRKYLRRYDKSLLHILHV